MSSSSPYRIEGNRIFSTDENHALETEAYESLEFASALIRKNGEFERTIRSSDTISIQIGTPYDRNLLISWSLWSLASRSHGTNVGSCGGCGNCGGDVKGEGMVIALLVTAIASLIIALVTTVTFTVRQSMKAHKVTNEIEDVQNKIDTTQKAQEVYTATKPILREQQKDLISQAALCALLSAGLVILIASASVALHAVVQKQSLLLSSLADPLAIAGGSLAGAALAGHALRPLVKLGLKEGRKVQYEELQSKMESLQDEVQIQSASSDNAKKKKLICASMESFS